MSARPAIVAVDLQRHPSRIPEVLGKPARWTSREGTTIDGVLGEHPLGGTWPVIWIDDRLWLPAGPIIELLPDYSERQGA